MKFKKKLNKLVSKNKQLAKEFVLSILYSENAHSVGVFFLLLKKELRIEIFKSLTKEEDINKVTFEIARQDSITKEKAKEIYKFFKEFKSDLTGGIDVAHDVLKDSLGAQKATDVITRLTSSLKVAPFCFIREIDSKILYETLKQEHPQTIALVLSYVQPDTASKILNKFPTPEKINILHRICSISSISPDIIREVERFLERKLSVLDCETPINTGGIDIVIDILSTDRNIEVSFLSSIEESDPILAERIKQKMFIFEDVLLLSDEDFSILSVIFTVREWYIASIGIDSHTKLRIKEFLEPEDQKEFELLHKENKPVDIKIQEEIQKRIVEEVKRLELKKSNEQILIKN
jgi:flagellar motor switch protein FliG